MKLQNNKKGFTLVEMLVVIAIVGMMSTLAIGGYIGYRKEVLLDLTVDNFISQLNQMQSRASYGEGEGSCYGVYFVDEGAFFTPKSFIQPFEGKKVWDVDGWKYVGCPDPDLDILEDLGWEDQIVVKSVEGVDRDFFVRALPPEGKLEANLQDVLQKQLTLVIGYVGAEGSVEPGDEISVMIDIANGTFNRIQTTTDANGEI